LFPDGVWDVIEEHGQFVLEFSRDLDAVLVWCQGYWRHCSIHETEDDTSVLEIALLHSNASTDLLHELVVAEIQ
jgi:hypothetical protein